MVRNYIPYYENARSCNDSTYTLEGSNETSRESCTQAGETYSMWSPDHALSDQ